MLDVSFDEPAAGAYEFLDRPHTHDYTALAVSAARGRDGTVRLGVTGVGPHGLLLAVGRRHPTPAVRATTPLASAWYRSGRCRCWCGGPCRAREPA